jgi:hypothetical protein
MKNTRTLRCLDCCPTRLRGAYMECSTCGALLCATHRITAGHHVYCTSCAKEAFLRRRAAAGRAIA